jgi:hypothetical protein
MTPKNQTHRLIEGLEYEDLKGLISSNVMIDLYKPKIGDEEDTVVLAFDVTYEEPANDLSSFIETSGIDHLDVEVSDAPDPTGIWKVFVEFQRDFDLYENIELLLKSVDQITSRQDNTWTYTAYKVKTKTEFNEQNFRRDVCMSRYEYRKKYIKKEKPQPNSELEEGWLRKIREMQSRND